MKITKKILSMILTVVMVLGLLPATVFATDSTNLMTLEDLRAVKGAFTLEAYNLGQGFLVEPSLYDKASGKSVSEITGNILISKNIEFRGDVSNEGIVTYFSGLAFDDSLEAQYPEYLQSLVDSGEISETNEDPDGILSEFDYSMYSGWVYTINSWFASWGADQSFPGQEITDFNTGELVTLGDIIRWHFTVYGYGADCGIVGNMMAETMGGNLFEQAEKSELIFILAAINDYYGDLDTDEVYETALAVAADPLATAAAVAAQEAVLTAYIEDTFFAEPEPEPVDRVAQSVTAQMNAVMAQLAADIPAPAFGTNAGEWTVLALARGGYYTKDNSYFADYYDRIVATVNEKAASINLNGALDKTKSTENSRLILALSAIGKDATSVGDWNLIKPFEDFNFIKKQGINGPVYALLALDSHNYQTENTTIREQCIQYILDKKIADGGWAMSGNIADPDITAMTLQALAPYRNQPAVAEAAEAAFAKLSEIQGDNGGYTSWGSVNSESCAQVVVACASWGINPDTDARFVKNGKSVVDALLAHYLEDEARFQHIIGDGANGMATDQSCYALVAYDRFMNGKTALYDYSDVTFDPVTTPDDGDDGDGDGSGNEGAGDGGNTEGGSGEGNDLEINASLGLPDKIENKAGNAFNAVISIDNWDNTAKLKLIDFLMTVPQGLNVAGVTAGDRLFGGEVTYHLDENGNLRCVYFDASKNTDLTVSGTEFPAEVFTVSFEIQEELTVENLTISIDGMSVKLSSDSTDENAMIVVGTDPVTDPDNPEGGTTGGGSGNIGVVVGVSFSAVELYTGDDVDLIPTTKKAVAVAVTGITKGSKLSYNDGTNQIEFLYNAAITEKTGISSYVALVDGSIEMENFVNENNFTIGSANAGTLIFGDSNGDDVVNAQDALAAVDAWLRKGETLTDTGILTLNVNGDSRINTFDALGIVEAFVNGSTYGVVTKAATITTKQ